VILAGGRATRLGGVPKPGLTFDGASLLSHALQAARGASAVVVVGPDTSGIGGVLPDGVLSAREEPAFAGPAAAIAAGLAAFHHNGGPAPWTLVLACDMPHASRGIAPLWEGLRAHPEVEGAMAVSADGRQQPLLGVYSTTALEREVAAASATSGLTNSSVFKLLARLNLLDVDVPAGSTDDVDTWEDAAVLDTVGRDPVPAVYAVRPSAHCVQLSMVRSVAAIRSRGALCLLGTERERRRHRARAQVRGLARRGGRHGGPHGASRLATRCHR